MAIFDGVASLFGADGEDKGRELNAQALMELQGLDTPDPEELQYQLQKMVYQGDLTPEQAQAILQDPSQFNNIATSGAGRSAQMQALAEMQGIGEDGGLAAEDLANLSTIQSRSAQAERGSREAISQNAKERGVYGSGMELVDQLINSQGSASRASQEGLDVAKMAQGRALEAIQGAGQLGGQLQGQEFGEQAQKAAAQDAIAKFNAQNKQGVATANTATRNAALDRNMQEKQRISDTNTTLGNEKAKADAASVQQAYQNKLGKANAIAGQYSNMAEGKRAAEKDQTAFTGGLLNTAGTVAGGYLAGKSKLSDEDKKKNIDDVDLEGFLSSIDPKAYEYKNPEDPGAEPGREVGVMAQDLEKTPAGRTMVKDTPNGKMLDINKGFGLILAALGALHDKMESEKEKKEEPAHV